MLVIEIRFEDGGYLKVNWNLYMYIVYYLKLECYSIWYRIESFINGWKLEKLSIN